MSQLRRKKVEIKNIGSFHDLQKAVHYEIVRQESLHSRGILIAQETGTGTTEERLPFRLVQRRKILTIVIFWRAISLGLRLVLISGERLESEMPEA